jgi:hypothetical protein
MATHLLDLYARVEPSSESTWPLPVSKAEYLNLLIYAAIVVLKATEDAAQAKLAAELEASANDHPPPTIGRRGSMHSGAGSGCPPPPSTHTHTHTHTHHLHRCFHLHHHNPPPPHAPPPSRPPPPPHTHTHTHTTHTHTHTHTHT